MQTFLPYRDFEKSAKCLDYRRLGKQRLEAKQIHDIVSGKATYTAWRNHPAVIMWQGYPDALAEYYNAILDEWIARGYNNTMQHLPVASHYLYPFWLGDPKFHVSHISNLIRKQPDHYRCYFGFVPDDIPYFWPKPDGHFDVRTHEPVYHFWYPTR